ncbi:zinc-dependent alcohol dehydrogenase [Leucobacter ruminantium]|uniref:Alcohol dehydrogenase catalytic domain-containing protein n=1 Tax=Leucobacter ruminantium TaxID=1289170 RepID=A0A939RZX8_9MICO|nr:zinc-binding dehydrogenase [Leucobacter ruminantium]MBO1806301.1 alcohol dehydrogenase catalytic domain-containing protein [Leucobacter ruminantium]
MRAAIFRGPGQLAIEEVDPVPPGPGEVAVEVRAAATCGTDLKSYRRGHPKLFPVLPARFGHEFAGVVTSVGEGVTRFRPGMRVVAANTAPCGACWACTINRESLCENLQFLNGAFAEEVTIPAAIVARNTYEIPESLAFEAAAPLEPLATVVHGIDESGIRLGDTVVVHGAGPIGLMFVRLATLRGANVVSVDQSAFRLGEAERAGAKQTVDITGLDADDVLEAIRSTTPGGRGADVSIEAVGLPQVWEQAVRALRPGGTAVLFGGTPKGAMFGVDSSAMHYEEYTLKGVFHHTPKYVQTAVNLLISGQVDGMSLISEVRPLDALVESLEDMAAGRGSKYALVP